MTPALSTLLLSELWPYALVFARVGGAIIVLPGFSEHYVMGRIRVLFALTLTVVIGPLLAPQLPEAAYGSPFSLALLLGEFAFGLFLGLLARMVMAALDVAGTTIGFQMALSNAFVFNPSGGTQSSIFSSFLGVTFLTAIFVLDLHFFLIRSLFESYSFFMPGQEFPLADMSSTMVQAVGQSFLMGVKMAGPFIIIGTLLYGALGVLNRLIPQIQIFFVAQPAIILGGFFVFLITLTSLFNVFVDYASRSFRFFGEF